MTDVTITSFGYGHSTPPAADLILDVRATLRDPLHTDLRALTGRDEQIQRHVANTPGATQTILALGTAAWTWRQTGDPVRVAVGCGGGRHRSVVIAEQVAALLLHRGLTVTVVHRDIDQPVLPAGPARAIGATS